VPHRTKQPGERDPHIVIILDEDQGQRGGDGQETLRDRRILHCIGPDLEFDWRKICAAMLIRRLGSLLLIY
jgi:hypothetical protein